MERNERVRAEGRADGLNDALRIVRRSTDLDAAVRAVAEALLRAREVTRRGL
jgi:hypothetical protein